MTHAIYKLLTFLDDEALSYHLDRILPDAITVALAPAGERLEITVFDDGRIEVLSFVGTNNIGDRSPAVARLYDRLNHQISN